MAAGEYSYPWGRHSGTISTDLEVIWGMLVRKFLLFREWFVSAESKLLFRRLLFFAILHFSIFFVFIITPLLILFNIFFGEFLQPLLFYYPFSKYWLFSALAFSLLMGGITAVITYRLRLLIAIVLFILIAPIGAFITSTTLYLLDFKCGYWWEPEMEPSPPRDGSISCGVYHQLGQWFRF